MCKTCVGCSIVSVAATWGFFTLLLTLLGAYKPGINAIWLAILICIAAGCCPVMNPKIAACCQAESIKKKKK